MGRNPDGCGRWWAAQPPRSDLSEGHPRAADRAIGSVLQGSPGLDAGPAAAWREAMGPAGFGQCRVGEGLCMGAKPTRNRSAWGSKGGNANAGNPKGSLHTPTIPAWPGPGAAASGCVFPCDLQGRASAWQDPVHDDGSFAMSDLDRIPDMCARRERVRGVLREHAIRHPVNWPTGPRTAGSRSRRQRRSLPSGRQARAQRALRPPWTVRRRRRLAALPPACFSAR